MEKTHVTAANSLKLPAKCKSASKLTLLRVKLGKIFTSIDWVQSNDYEMLSSILAEINFVKEFTLYSDKFAIKDQINLETDFARDLVKSRLSSRATLNHYVKGIGHREEQADGKISDEEKKKSEVGLEALISRN